MVEITISEIIKKRIPNFKLGIVVGNEVKIDKDDERFGELYKELVDYIKKTFAKDPLSSDEIIGHVRRLYRRIGWEPTRYRPSSEALARRILQDKGWYRINNAVDLGNLVSARFHLPMGLYDLDKINGPVRVDVGRRGESYEGISKSEIHAEGKLILRDQSGIFGNPTADSKRTSVEAETRNILAVFFTPPEVNAFYLEKTLNTLIQYYEPICGGTEKRILIFED